MTAGASGITRAAPRVVMAMGQPWVVFSSPTMPMTASS